MGWIPLSDYQLKGKLELKIKEIAEVLINLPDSEVESISLMSGKTGIALFLYYYARFIESEKYFDHATRLLKNIFDEINDGKVYHSFAGGIAGIGFTINNLSANDLIVSDNNDPFESIDAYLSAYMMKDIKNGNYDYLHGALGVGLYFLSSLNEKREKNLERLIEKLESISHKNDDGSISWISPMQHNGDQMAYNLGLSHGLASIIGFLARAYEKQICVEKTIKLLSGAVSFLIKNKQDFKEHLSFFPNWVIKGGYPQTSRLAWCYGDLGIAFSLYYAAGVVSKEEWASTALEILKYSTERRDLLKNGLKDAGLCHGTAGVAHIFNRLFNMTKLPHFQEAAGYWFEKSLEMAKFFNGFAGYQSYIYDTNEEINYVNNAGFLEGVAGIGLSMMGAVSSFEPGWDEALLLS